MLNSGRLRYAVEAVRASVFGIELHPTLEEKAAALAFAIVTGHVFLDGNKRTGVETLFLVLELNGWTLLASDDDLVAQAVDLAAGNVSFEGFVAWIRGLMVAP